MMDINEERGKMRIIHLITLCRKFSQLCFLPFQIGFSGSRVIDEPWRVIRPFSHEMCASGLVRAVELYNYTCGLMAFSPRHSLSLPS